MSRDELLQNQKLVEFEALASDLLQVTMPGRSTLWPEVANSSRFALPMSRSRLKVRNWLLPDHLGFGEYMRSSAQVSYQAKHLA